MLFGAAKLQRLLSSEVPGNPENYLKDSAYVHMRNLYNFFTVSKPGNDSSITQFGDSVIASKLFPSPWKPGLNVDVMHIAGNRANSLNVQNGKHINECIQDFATDIESMWSTWVAATKDPKLRVQLAKSLTRANQQAQDDFEAVKNALRKA